MTLVRQLAWIAVTLCVVPVGAAAQTWRLVDVQHVEPKRVEGRGGDFITYTPDIKFTPPQTLTIGQPIDITASATYTYGSGAGTPAGGGRPKSVSIGIDVPNGNAIQRYPLVPNTCTGTGTQPPALPESGSIGPLTASGRLTDADRTTRSFTIAVTVQANIFCFEPEAGGAAGIRATYELGDGAPAVNNPPQAEIYVYDPDKIVTAGQVVYLKAKVRDEDPATLLTYTWTVSNLVTGQSRRVVKRGTRTVRWTVGEGSKYRIELTVADTGGLTGDATPVEVTSEKPTIEEFRVADPSQQEITVSDYWAAGVPAARRGDWIEMRGTLRHFNRELHCVSVYVDGVLASRQSPHPEGWRPINAGLDGAIVTFTLTVPPDIWVGKHKVELATIRKSKNPENPCAGRELHRKALPDELLVLFNGFPSAREADPDVNSGKALSMAAAFRYSLDPRDRAWSYSMTVDPTDGATLQVTEQVLQEMVEKNADNKTILADAVAVASALTVKNGNDVLHGEWNAAVLAKIKKGALPGTLPWHWTSAGDIHAEHLRIEGRVNHGQCWVFATVLTGSLRSIGIPARMITMSGSAHDTAEPWGVSQAVVATDRDGYLHGDGWNFHVWVEAWIPSHNGESGWVALDATPQGRAGDPSADSYVAAPALSEVIRTSHLEIPKPYADGNDAVFVFTEANLPTFTITVDCECRRPPKVHPDDPKPPCASDSNCWMRPPGVKPFYGRASEADFMACINDRGRNPPYGSRTDTSLPILECIPGGRMGRDAMVVGENGNRENHIAGYAVPRNLFPQFTQRQDEGLGDRLWRTARRLLAGLFSMPAVQAQVPAPAGEVTIKFPEVVPLQRPVTGAVSFRNLPDDQPATLVIRLSYLPEALSGGAPANTVSAEVVHQERVRITPTGRAFSRAVEIPATALATSGAYELQIGISGIAGAQQRITVEGLPLAIVAPAAVALGATFEVRGTLTNALSTAVEGASLELSLSTGLESAGPLVVSSASLAAGRTLEVRAPVRATTAGRKVVRARGDGSAGASLRDVEVTVQGPRRLAVRGFPVGGAAPGAEVAITAEIGNPERAAVKGAVATLTTPDGIEVVGSPTQRVDVIEGQRVWKPSWRVRGASAGTYTLRVAASAGAVSGAGTIGLIVGGNDADDLPVPLSKPEPVPIDPGEDPSDPSLAAEDFEDDLPDPASPTEAASGGAAGGGGGGGGGGAGGGGGRSLFSGSSSAVWLAVIGIGIGIVVLALAIVVIARRRRDGGE